MDHSIEVKGALEDVAKVDGRFQHYVNLSAALPAEDKIFVKMESVLASYVDLASGPMMSRYLDPGSKQAIVESIRATQTQLQTLVDAGTSIPEAKKESQKEKISRYCDNAIALISAPIEQTHFERRVMNTDNQEVREQKKISTIEPSSCTESEKAALTKISKSIGQDFIQHLGSIQASAQLASTPSAQKPPEPSMLSTLKDYGAKFMKGLDSIDNSIMRTQSQMNAAITQYIQSVLRDTLALIAPIIRSDKKTTASPVISSTEMNSSFTGQPLAVAPQPVSAQPKGIESLPTMRGSISLAGGTTKQVLEEPAKPSSLKNS